MTQPLIYTTDQCAGCNRCISVCPIITANISTTGSNGQQRIEVNPLQCIGCGSCFDVCEHQARTFFDDTERFFSDLQRGENISLLIAPAFLAHYPKEYKKVLGGLKQLGVRHLISVSTGADITTWAYIQYITKNHFEGGISQPCPAVTTYIEKYVPKLLPKLMPVHSPMMCTAIYARKYMHITDKLAFISPCIAKKLEIEDPNTHDNVQYNVTFERLMNYMTQHHLLGPDVSEELEYGLGAIYPMPGGLKENVYWFCGEDLFIRQVEGEKHVYNYLKDYAQRVSEHKPLPFMVDALNCSQGCLYGTAINPARSESDDIYYELARLRSRLQTKEAKKSNAARLRKLNRRFSSLKLEDFLRTYTDQSKKTQIQQPSESELDRIFLSMEKHTTEERNMNCGACGYNNCHDMAVAIHNHCNSPEGCIQYEKKKVELESQKILTLSNQAKQKSDQITAFIANDFDKLDLSISEVALGNEQTAQETSQIQGTMEGIRDFCEHMADSFLSISDLLTELEHNNKNITKISKQTGLISMNASVEAVHAGAAGHGFAVLAAEMKELSDSCEEAAADSIANKEQITQTIHTLSVKATELQNLVNAVSDNMCDLAARTEQIASAAETVREISKNVRAAMSNLSNE